MSNDFRDLDNKRIPIYINFVKFAINGSVISEKYSLTSVEEFKTFTHLCNDNDRITLDFEFKTIYDYFSNLIYICNMLNDDFIDVYDFYNVLLHHLVNSNVLVNIQYFQLRKMLPLHLYMHF